MKIVVCNIGSTSFQFQLLDMESENQLAKGYIERVGEPDAIVNFWVGDEKCFHNETSILTQKEAVKYVLEYLLEPKYNLLKNLDEIDGIGFKQFKPVRKMLQCFLILMF